MGGKHGIVLPTLDVFINYTSSISDYIPMVSLWFSYGFPVCLLSLDHSSQQDDPLARLHGDSRGSVALGERLVWVVAITAPPKKKRGRKGSNLLFLHDFWKNVWTEICLSLSLSLSDWGATMSELQSLIFSPQMEVNELILVILFQPQDWWVRWALATCCCFSAIVWRHHTLNMFWLLLMQSHLRWSYL